MSIGVWYCEFIDRLYPEGSLALDMTTPHWARVDEVRAVTRVCMFIFHYSQEQR